jgi:hypothetical protein
MHDASLLECEAWLAVGLGLEKGTNLIEDPTEAPSGVKGFAPTQGTGALLNTAVVPLQMVIHIAVRPVHHPLPDTISKRAGVGIVAIRGDAV